MIRAYYNEFDPKAAAWLRQLIKCGHITDGTVDERSINDVQPADLVGYDRCHFFAGIGGWEVALKLADWGDSPVWTGSCPCQPFSAAGKQKAQADHRHLWPVFNRLIAACRPSIVFGEQVASAIGHGWLDGICTDLEAEGYACGSVVLGAHSVGSPHIRQRLYWVADAGNERQSGQHALLRAHKAGRNTSDLPETSGNSVAHRLADTSGLPSSEHERESGIGSRREAGPQNSAVGGGVGFGLGNTASDGREQRRAEPGGSVSVASSGSIGGLGDTDHAKKERLGQHGGGMVSAHEESNRHDDTDPWSRYDFIPCRDGKARRVESGTFPLAHGLSKGMVYSGDPVPSINSTGEARVMRLRGYGNAIVPQVAAQFVKACMEAIND